MYLKIICEHTRALTAGQYLVLDGALNNASRTPVPWSCIDVGVINTMITHRFSSCEIEEALFSLMSATNWRGSEEVYVVRMQLEQVRFEEGQITRNDLARAVLVLFWDALRHCSSISSQLFFDTFSILKRCATPFVVRAIMRAAQDQDLLSVELYRLALKALEHTGGRYNDIIALLRDAERTGHASPLLYGKAMRILAPADITQLRNIIAMAEQFWHCDHRLYKIAAAVVEAHAGRQAGAFLEELHEKMHLASRTASPVFGLLVGPWPGRSPGPLLETE